MIGGVDIVLSSPPEAWVAETVLAAVRRIWRGAYFQDAESRETHLLSGDWAQLYGSASREFFVYRDRAASEAWARDGASPENANTMLHFLLDDVPERHSGLQRLTLVCDERTREIEGLLAALQQALWGNQWAPLWVPQAA